MRFETICNGDFVQIQAFVALGYPHGTSSGMVSAGEKLGTRRSADRADVESLADRTGQGESIKVWRKEIRIALKAKIAPALVVREKNDDIGMLAAGKSRVCVLGTECLWRNQQRPDQPAG